MSKILFKVSGDKRTDGNNVFLTSEDRLKNNSDFGKSYYNNLGTYISLPKAFYKENFKYCRSSGIYRNTLSWKDISQYMIVEQFTSKGYITV